MIVLVTLLVSEVDVDLSQIMFTIGFLLCPLNLTTVHYMKEELNIPEPECSAVGALKSSLLFQNFVIFCP